MVVRDDRSDAQQTTTGFRDPLKVQSLTSAKSKFLSQFLTAEAFKVALAVVPVPLVWRSIRR